MIYCFVFHWKWSISCGFDGEVCYDYFYAFFHYLLFQQAQRRPPLLSLCGFSCRAHAVVGTISSKSQYWHLHTVHMLSLLLKQILKFSSTKDACCRLIYLSSGLTTCLFQLYSQIFGLFPEVHDFQNKIFLICQFYSQIFDFITEVPYKRKTLFGLYSQNFDFSPLKLLSKNPFSSDLFSFHDPHTLRFCWAAWFWYSFLWFWHRGPSFIFPTTFQSMDEFKKYLLCAYSV